MSTAEIRIKMPDGERRLPLFRTGELALVARCGAPTIYAVRADRSIDLSDMALDPTALVSMVAQLYASQKGLEPPRASSRGFDGEALTKWFQRVTSHAEREPVADAWADFLVDTVNQDRPEPEASA